MGSPDIADPCAPSLPGCAAHSHQQQSSAADVSWQASPACQRCRTLSAGIPLLLSSRPNTNDLAPSPASPPLCTLVAEGCLPRKDTPRPSLLAPPEGSDPSACSGPAGAKRDLGSSCGASACGSEALRASRLRTSCDSSSRGRLAGCAKSYRSREWRQEEVDGGLWGRITGVR